MLEDAGTVGVPELVERFGVSAVTVRKDLELLERRHLLRRVRGGAVVAEGADEGAFELRLRIPDFPLQLLTFLLPVVVVVWLFLNRMTYGRKLYADGTNDVASRFANIEVRRTRFGA